MPDPAPKFFKRQSGQMKAVREEVQAILDVTKEVFERVKTEPPPPAIFRKPSPEAGTYKLVLGQEEEGEELVEVVEQVQPPRLRARAASSPDLEPPRRKLPSRSDG